MEAKETKAKHCHFLAMDCPEWQIKDAAVYEALPSAKAPGKDHSCSILCSDFFTFPHGGLKARSLGKASSTRWPRCAGELGGLHGGECQHHCHCSVNTWDCILGAMKRRLGLPCIFQGSPASCSWWKSPVRGTDS